MNSSNSNQASPHRRYNPLADRWVLVSPQRDQRPWQGQEEPPTAPEPAYVQDCYLCPGNQRAGGQHNPQYDGVFVFDNDFPALLPEAQERAHRHPLLLEEPVRGRCRVVCYSPRHDLTLADMSEAQILEVINTWAEQTARLGQRYKHVQIFENRGASMGCSNAHPHGQIWALDTLPSEIQTEDQQQANYLAAHKRPLLLDYALLEQELQERVVCVNDDWIALIPWWATWPFETLLMPLHPRQSLPDVPKAQRQTLASILKELLCGYNRLFNAPFPYSMGWHGAPGSGHESSGQDSSAHDRSDNGNHWQLHAHFYPPLLRSATVRKHMVGFEMLGEAQRDLTPERAARRLREVMVNEVRTS